MNLGAMAILTAMLSLSLDASMTRFVSQPASTMASSALTTARRGVAGSGPLGTTPVSHMSADATMVDGSAAARAAAQMAQEFAFGSMPRWNTGARWNSFKQNIPSASSAKSVVGPGAGAAGAMYVFNKLKEQEVAELRRKQAVQEASKNLQAYEEAAGGVEASTKIPGIVMFYKNWIEKLNGEEVVKEYRSLVDDVIATMQKDFDDKWSSNFFSWWGSVNSTKLKERDSERFSLDEKIAQMGDKLYDNEGTVFTYDQNSPIGQVSYNHKLLLDAEFEELKNDLVAMKTYLLQSKANVPAESRVSLPDFKPAAKKPFFGASDARLWKRAAIA